MQEYANQDDGLYHRLNQTPNHLLILQRRIAKYGIYPLLIWPRASYPGGFIAVRCQVLIVREYLPAR